MRCNSIKIHAEIPLQTNCDDSACFRDGNGNVYEIDAVKKACDETKAGLPIIRYDSYGFPVCVGVVSSFEWNSNGHIDVEGILWHGGTSEIITPLSNHTTSISFESVCLGVD